MKLMFRVSFLPRHCDTAGGCVNLRTGGGGQKIRNFCGRHIWKPPCWEKYKKPQFFTCHFQFSDRPDQDAAGKAEQEADRERLRDPHRGAGDVQVRLWDADQVPGRLQPLLHPHPARLWHEVTSASRQPGLYQVSHEMDYET